MYIGFFIGNIPADAILFLPHVHAHKLRILRILYKTYCDGVIPYYTHARALLYIFCFVDVLKKKKTRNKSRVSFVCFMSPSNARIPNILMCIRVSFNKTGACQFSLFRVIHSSETQQPNAAGQCRFRKYLIQFRRKSRSQRRTILSTATIVTEEFFFHVSGLFCSIVFEGRSICFSPVPCRLAVRNG